MPSVINVISKNAKILITTFGFVAIFVVGTVLYLSNKTNKHTIFAYDNSSPNGDILFICSCVYSSGQGDGGGYIWQSNTPGKTCPSVATLKSKGYPCP